MNKKKITRKTHDSSELTDIELEGISGGASKSCTQDFRQVGNNTLLSFHADNWTQEEWNKFSSAQTAAYNASKQGNTAEVGKQMEAMNASLNAMGSNKVVMSVSGAGDITLKPKGALCTVAAQFGYLTPEVWLADMHHTSRHYHTYTKSGYGLWAVPVAKYAAKHPQFLKAMTYIVRCWAYNMAAREGVAVADHTFTRWLGGLLLEAVGVPICFCLGWFKSILSPNARD